MNSTEGGTMMDKAPEQTRYQVQKADQSDGSWEDVDVFAASSGEAAIKAAAAMVGSSKEPSPGLYRAFTARSDVQLVVETGLETVVRYTKPTAAPAPPVEAVEVAS